MAYQKRQTVTTRIPVHRKGTKYVARASSNLTNGVPVVIALRDMLKLARNAKEVQSMVNQKLLKINNREVKDIHESIVILNHLTADKTYRLILNPQNRFTFEETKEKTRPCKIIGKKLIGKNKIQINLHDGTNIISKEKLNVQDTVYLDEKNKITKHVQLENGKPCFVISGKHQGNHGTIEDIHDNIAKVKLKEEHSVSEIEKRRVIAL